MRPKTNFLSPFMAVLLLIVINASALAQEPIYRKIPDHIMRLKREADSLYNIQQYVKAALTNKAIIRESGKYSTYIEWLNAASNYSLAGEIDSSMVYLKGAADRGYSNFAILQVDPELEPLHQHADWKKVSQQVSDNRFTYMKKANREVILALDTVTMHDQSTRWQLEELRKKKGIDSKEYKALNALAEKYDEENREIVSRILEKYGWLSNDEIGTEGGLALFIVIQHAPVDYQKKYYHLVKAAVDKKYMHPNIICYIHDRIAVAEGKNQRYGTQFGTYEGTDRYFVYPVEDVKNLDQRRADRGLETMAQYCNYYNIKWSLKYYTRELKKVEKELNWSETKKEN